MIRLFGKRLATPVLKRTPLVEANHVSVWQKTSKELQEFYQNISTDRLQARVTARREKFLQLPENKNISENQAHKDLCDSTGEYQDEVAEITRRFHTPENHSPKP